MSEPHETGSERRVRSDCGFRTGWFDPEDAVDLATDHAEECDQCVFPDTFEYKDREKEGTNYSDHDLGPTKDCPNCGAGNIADQALCAVCGGSMV